MASNGIPSTNLNAFTINARVCETKSQLSNELIREQLRSLIAFLLLFSLAITITILISVQSFPNNGKYGLRKSNFRCDKKIEIFQFRYSFKDEKVKQSLKNHWTSKLKVSFWISLPPWCRWNESEKKVSRALKEIYFHFSFLRSSTLRMALVCMSHNNRFPND